MDEEEIRELAREIALRMAPDALMDAEDVAAMLKYDPRYVINELQHSPDFPKAIRFELRGGRKTNPRWLRSDIMAMIERKVRGIGRAGRTRRLPGG